MRFSAGRHGITQTVVITVQAAEFTPPSQQELEQITQAITQIENW